MESQIPLQGSASTLQESFNQEGEMSNPIANKKTARLLVRSYQCKVAGCNLVFPTQKKKSQHLKAVHPYPHPHPPLHPSRGAAFSTSSTARQGHNTTDDSTIFSLQRLKLNCDGDLLSSELDTLIPATEALKEVNKDDELESATPPHIATIMQQAVEPTKRALIAQINTIVRQVVTRNNRTLKGFRLQERGSLFSPLIEHISDADIQLFTRKRVVSQAQCECILEFCQRHLYLGNVKSIRWASLDGIKKEVPFAEFDFTTSLQDQDGPGYAAFIVTGIYPFANGFLIPVDIALSCGGESNEPQAQRCAKIMTKLQEGDFAKVLQKIRPLFKKGVARDSLVKEVNTHVGRLRYVVKQLGMIQDILETVSRSAEGGEEEEKAAQEEVQAFLAAYLQSTLGFPPDVLSLQDLTSSSSSSCVLAECERELQRRALSVIQRHHNVIEAKLLRANGGKGIDEYLHAKER